MLQVAPVMVAWMVCVLSLLLGLRLLFAGSSRLLPGLGQERSRLAQVVFLLQEIEETLGAGVVPPADRWESLRLLPAPWGELAFDSLQELRSRGGAVLPTLKRLQALARDQDATLAEARARSSQAVAQALVCAGLVPVFGSALYWLLPALAERAWAWAAACLAAAALAGVGGGWMLAMAGRARWAGLPAAERPWVLASQCAGERFLALVRSGNPADLAWVRACALLRQEAPGLAGRWSASIWKPGESVPARHPATRALEDAGTALRKAVQVSLMEGRPCTERAEAALAGLRLELRALVERELGLLGPRALKPLFLCVAPAIFLLLALALGLSWQQVAGTTGPAGPGWGG